MENKPARISAVVSTIGFFLGVSSIATLAISNMLKYEYGISSPSSGMIGFITQAPWFLKFIPAYHSDSRLLWGYRSKSYLFLMAPIGFSFYQVLADFQVSLWLAILMMTLWTLIVTFSDVLAQMIFTSAAEDRHHNDEGKVTKSYSLYVACRHVGQIAGYFISGLILGNTPNPTISQIDLNFNIASYMAGFLIIAGFIVPEKRIRKGDLGKVVDFKKILGFFKNGQVIRTLLFFQFIQIMPTLGTSLFYFYENQLNFSSDQIAYLNIVDSLGSTIGAVTLGTYLKKVHFKKIYLVATILSALVGLVTLFGINGWNIGISSYAFFLFNGFIQGVFSILQVLPVFSLVARMCPKNIEATMLALLTSFLNFGSNLSTVLGSLISDFLGINGNAGSFGNLGLFFTICDLAILVPLIFLNFIDVEATLQTAANYDKAELEQFEDPGVSFIRLNDDGTAL